MAEPAAREVGGAPGSARALGGAWLIRWDAGGGDVPRVSTAAGRADEASLWRSPSGGWVLFDGYLLERDRAPGGLDAAVVAEAHRRLGDGVVDALRGGYALAIWEPECRQLTVARDALGLHACFYRHEAGVLLVAASLDAIVGCAEARAGFDRAVVAEYLQNQTASQLPGETFYEGVRRLPPAHVLRAGDGGIAVSRYWDPVPPGFQWASAEETRGFDERLSRAVDRCLAAGGDSLALSGGFDSVSVAALAAEARAGRAPLHAVCLSFAGTVCDESETQAAVARALGMPELVETLEEALGGRDIVEGALSLSASSPSPVLSPWQAAYSGLLRSAGRRGLGRLLMGTGGDDLLNVDPSWGADRLAARDLAGLWRFCRACQRTSPRSPARVVRGVLWDHALVPELTRLGRRALESVAPPALAWVRQRRRGRALPEWAHPADAALGRRLAERSDAAGAAAREPGDGAYVGTLRRLSQSALLLIERDQSHAWARHLGFTFLFPYFDRDLVELSLRIPPDELIAGGRHKAPLRRLVAARLPSVAMRARKVDFTDAVHGVLRPAARRAWTALGGAAALGDLGLVDAGRLDRFVRDYADGGHAGWLSVWVALSTEAWLRARAHPPSSPQEQEAAA